MMTFRFNPDLKTIPLPFAWQGTPVDAESRFQNEEFKFNESLRELFKWQFMRNPQREEKKTDTWKLQTVRSQFLDNTDDCIVWLGHASFFIRLAGISLLIDPVFFDLSPIRRLLTCPVDAGQFKNLDYILISHDHRDHCDKKTIQQLTAQNPHTTWLTGLNLDTLLAKFTGSSSIQAAGWYQEYKTEDQIRIVYVPSRHWGRRLLFDTNTRLWGGFVIEGAGKTIYFGGDSGYDGHFRRMGEIFHPIDYALLGIGAYKPEFFMGQSHTSPADALRGFQDTGAKKMIPMHYGTFDLADEPPGDPERVLRKLEAGNEDIVGRICYLAPGEQLHL